MSTAKMTSKFGKGLMTVAIFAAGIGSANASLMLTADGVNLGFSLSTFVSGFPNNAVGPLGMGVNSKGQIIVDSGFDKKNYVFNDVDNQTLANAVSSTSFSGWPPAYTSVQLNGTRTVWGSYGWNGGGALVKFNDDGTVAATYSNIHINNGMWTNPVNEHIIATGSGGLLDIDVSGATPTVRVINSAGSDGVTVSPDGKRVYTTSAVYDIDTGINLGNYSVSGADGMGIITSSNAALNGQIIVNTTNGNVVMMDPTTFAQTIIANGGSRGDYTAADYNDGSLLLTQSDSIMRLSCGRDCAIGSTPPTVSRVPEPSEVALMGIGAISLSVVARRQRQSSRS